MLIKNNLSENLVKSEIKHDIKTFVCLGKHFQLLKKGKTEERNNLTF